MCNMLVLDGMECMHCGIAHMLVWHGAICGFVEWLLSLALGGAGLIFNSWQRQCSKETCKENAQVLESGTAPN